MEKLQKLEKKKFNDINYYWGKNIFIFPNVLDKDFCQELIDFYTVNNNEKYMYSKHIDNQIFDKKIYSAINTRLTIINQDTHCRIHTDSHYIFSMRNNPTPNRVAGAFDAAQGNVKSIVIVIGLNNDYKGGIWKFPQQNISLKLNQGDMLCFPPFWTHPYSVSETKNNSSRYTIHSWGLEAKKSIGWINEKQNIK